MPVNSGAGAAVASGAGYQARVAAYFVACAIAKLPIPVMQYGALSRMAMETAEAIDDVQITFENGKRALIQAKRSISFSTAPESELYSVLKQFASQQRSSNNSLDEYCLFTSSEASKRVTGDMRIALDVARDCPKEAFERDQPKSIVTTFNALVDSVLEIQKQLNIQLNKDDARDLLAKSRVVVLDVDPTSALEQAIVLALHSAGYAAPSETWGKIISDCLEWARRRQTLDIHKVAATYQNLRIENARPEKAEDHRYLMMTFSADGLEVGRELAVARATSDTGPFLKGQILLLEFYRFNSDCKPRIRFEKNRLILESGAEFELWGRFATWEGLNRFVDENIGRIGGEEVVLARINSEENYETGLCASTHRAALEAAASKRDLLKCIHCELPVMASMSPVAEAWEGSDLTVGLSHKECLLPSDRILGRADSTLFRENPELVNFDVNAWFRAAHSGCSVLHAAEILGQSITPILWGGTPTHEDIAGRYIVVSLLKDGSEQITTRRGRVQRFTKDHAEKFSTDLQNWIRQSQEDGDPLCYSDQSRAFSRKSALMSRLGGKEKTLSITSVEVRAYDARDAASYLSLGSWYAPLLALRHAETLELITLEATIPLISDPMALGRYLENWRSVGFEIPDHEIELLLSDQQVDQMMDFATRKNLEVIIDPVLSEDGEVSLVRGHPVQAVSVIIQQHETDR